MNVNDWTLTMCDKCFERGHERKDCAWTSEELHSIHKIAAFIGARLQYPMPLINGQGNPWVSTIKVDQHKEKFFWARVYCDLADPETVKKKWEWIRSNDDLKKKLTRRHFPTEDVSGDEPSENFVERCMRFDAWHYRTVYLDMISLLSEKFKSRVRGQADYVELLLDTVQDMHEWFDKRSAEENDALSFYRTKYRARTNEELREKLSKFYEQPSIREWIGDA